ncbi:MAG: hypothetical protein ACOH18_00125 [Candidatus Saccharimonadaceae bacterium]
MLKKTIWDTILDSARLYPSPHNSQPIKVQLIDDNTADVFYDLDLGLPAESYGIPFAHVCVGVFLESLRIVAANSDMLSSEKLFLDNLDFNSTNRLHRVARITLISKDRSSQDVALYEAFMKRQTSRRPYDSRPVHQDILAEVDAIAKRAGYTFSSTDNPKLVAEIIAINQATLFDDLQNDAVFSEIMHWLRFSRKQALQTKDGLSAETMLMPGPLLKFTMKRRWLWTYPGIGHLMRYVYLRTMKGVHQLGWIEGPFNTTGDFLEAGRVFMKVWIYLTQRGVYIHPFGTVITNPKSHKLFVKKATINEDENSMAWMLFRFGYSKQPPKAHRRSTESMIIKKEL